MKLARRGSAQIGVNDGLVRLDVGGRPLGDQAAAIENQNPVAERHHHAEIVIDEDDRQSMAPKLPKQISEPVGFRVIEPGRRLVEHQQPRFGRQRNGDGEQLLLAIGKCPRLLIGAIG